MDRKHQLDALPRLWQRIQIEKGWEDALEAVLRERLNSVALEQLELRASGRKIRLQGNGRCSSQCGRDHKEYRANQQKKPGRKGEAGYCCNRI